MVSTAPLLPSVLTADPRWDHPMMPMKLLEPFRRVAFARRLEQRQKDRPIPLLGARDDVNDADATDPKE